MRGVFDLKLRNAGGLKDEDFEVAKGEGRIGEVLSGLQIDRHLTNQNVIMHYVPPCMFKNVFGHGIPDGPHYTRYNNHWCGNVVLMTTDDEPEYGDSYDYYGAITSHPDNVGSSTAYGNSDDGGVEANIYDKNPDGKEEIYQRWRFLWLPTQGNNNNTRSLGLVGAEDQPHTTSNRWRYLSGRVRLKDPDTGLPVVIIKNINQVLVIEYTIYWVSL